MKERTEKRRADDVAKAVKDALDDKRMEDMAKQNNDLSNQITQGFAEVRERLNTVNGTLATHTGKIALLENVKTAVAFQERIMWTAITILTGMVVFFIQRT